MELLREYRVLFEAPLVIFVVLSFSRACWRILDIRSAALDLALEATALEGTAVGATAPDDDELAADGPQAALLGALAHDVGTVVGARVVGRVRA